MLNRINCCWGELTACMPRPVRSPLFESKRTVNSSHPGYFLPFSLFLFLFSLVQHQHNKSMNEQPRLNSPPSLVPRLPLEVLRLVFIYFCRHCSGDYEQPFRVLPLPDNTATLYNLCLVSRCFRDVAQGMLHHSFDIIVKHQLPGNRWQRRLEPFLRTIASRPDLAHLVSAVFLPWKEIESLDFDEGKVTFDKCARSMGTTASKIYKLIGRNKAPVSNKIEEAFFLGQPISDDEREDCYVPIVASELMTITMAILPNLAHLGLVEDTDLHRRWNFDLSAPTLNALGITTLPLKTFENDYGMPKLLSRTKNLEMLITGGRGQVPELPNLRGLHIRALDGNYISTDSASPIFENARYLATFSFTATGTPLSNVIECLNQPRFHASLESIRLDLRCHRDLDGGLQAMSNLKLFTRLKKLFVPIASIYSSSDTELENQALASILPPSIEYLTLVEHVTPTARGLLHKDLLRLIDKRPTLFPHLREIISDSVQVCDEGLINVFWQAGVALIHEELPRSN